MLLIGLFVAGVPLILTCFYGISGLAGKVDFTVRHLSSVTTNFPSNWDFSSGQPCIGGSGARAVSNCFSHLRCGVILSLLL